MCDPMEASSGSSNCPTYALLIGINYVGTNYYLPGCENDILDMYKFLKNHGFTAFDILGDSEVFDGIHPCLSPTAMNIVGALGRMILWAAENPTGRIFIHYSGHGCFISELTAGSESDGHDECMVSSDIQLIPDDYLRSMLGRIPEGVTVFSLMDCCHSATILDLKYMMTTQDMTVETSRPALAATVIMLSGCTDAQTSLSALINNRWSGVMTKSFLMLMDFVEQSPHKRISPKHVWVYTNLFLRNFPQTPQLTSSVSDFDSKEIECSPNSFSIVNRD